MSKYTEDTVVNPEYVKLEIPHNKLIWRSGDEKLASLAKEDLAMFLGGWRASVRSKAKEGVPSFEYPSLPMPIVTRLWKGEDYDNYSDTKVFIKIVCSRWRFELLAREDKKIIKNKYGFPVVTAVTKNFTAGSGYTPKREVFALSANEKGETFSPVLITLDNWNTWRSWNDTEKKFLSLPVKEGHEIIRCIGTRGKEKNGKTLPILNEYNGGFSTPFEPLNLHTPIYSPITSEFDELWQLTQNWKNCPAWNKEFVGTGIHEEALPELPETSSDFPFGDPTQD